MKDINGDTIIHIFSRMERRDIIEYIKLELGGRDFDNNYNLSNTSVSDILNYDKSILAIKGMKFFLSNYFYLKIILLVIIIIYYYYYLLLLKIFY